MGTFERTAQVRVPTGLCCENSRQKGTIFFIFFYEHLGGEDDKPKPPKPKPPKPPPPTRTISESSGNEGSEASSILEVKKSAPETAIPPPIPEEGDENKGSIDYISTPTSIELTYT